MSDRDTKAKEYDAVVSGLRDEPCAFKRQCFRDGWDAAIASLPDMVKPLGWECVKGHYYSGDYVLVSFKNGFLIDCKDEAIACDLTLDEAKAAAQAHHTAAILSALGVTK